jgi:hypothetical protein
LRRHTGHFEIAGQFQKFSNSAELEIFSYFFLPTFSLREKGVPFCHPIFAVQKWGAFLPKAKNARQKEDGKNGPLVR